jgi:hypothetical protein
MTQLELSNIKGLISSANITTIVFNGFTYQLASERLFLYKISQ